MSTTCDRCTALQRWLRDLKLDIEKEIAKHELGFSSQEDERVSRQLFDEAWELFTQTEALYKRHQREHAENVGR